MQALYEGDRERRLDFILGKMKLDEFCFGPCVEWQCNIPFKWGGIRIPFNIHNHYLFENKVQSNFMKLKNMWETRQNSNVFRDCFTKQSRPTYMLGVLFFGQNSLKFNVFYAVSQKIVWSIFLRLKKVFWENNFQVHLWATTKRFLYLY